MKKLLTLLCVLSIVILLPELLFSQPPPMLPSDVTQAPIDGGLSLLGLAGGAYFLKKIRSKK